MYIITKIVNNTENYEIYCNATDTCFIGCQSAEACDLMSLYCDGTCYIDCDQSSGFDCPTITGDNVYEWNFTNISQFSEPHSGECHEAYSCALDTIEDSVSREVECWGYYSCTEAIKIESDSVYEDIQCD